MIWARGVRDWWLIWISGIAGCGWWFRLRLVVWLLILSSRSRALEEAREDRDSVPFSIRANFNGFCFTGKIG